MATTFTPAFEEATYKKVAARLIPFLFLCYIVAFLDRVNVGFAKLQMASDLHFSDAIYGFGAGIFFIGYFIFEVPSNVILEKVGARIWIARIMITWGIISSAFMFTGDIHWGAIATMFHCTDAQFTFYFLRFWLGVAEAGFFPGVILYLTYWFPGARRAKMVALFMTAIGVAQLVGSPVSGAIMQFTDGAYGWRGWQWLFLLEGVPSVIIGILVFVIMHDGPKSTPWLTQDEKNLLIKRVEEDNAAKRQLGRRHGFIDAFKDGRLWALALVYFAMATCFYAVGFWMPTIIQELGIDKKDLLKVGLVSMIPWGASIIAMIYWGTHSDRTGERRWHCATGFLVEMVGLLVLAVAHHSPVISIIGLTLITIGWAGCVVTFWSLPTAFLSGTAAAAGIAWINSVGNLGGYFGPDLIGTIRTAAGGAAEAAFFALAGLAFVGALIVILLPKTQPTPVQGEKAVTAPGG
ncbi:MAG: MFS transporter [Betaproteobacteria bacterium]|nr:MFS transporter [Betaproteobacteria bacterium]